MVTLFPLYLALTLSILILIVYRFFIFPHDESANVGITDHRPYDSVGRLLSPEENAFYAALNQTTRDEFTIHAKVSLSNIIHPRGHVAATGRTWAWEYSHFQPVHFLLCDPEKSDIIAVIQMESPGEQRSKRRKSDHFLIRSLDTAGIAFIRVPKQESYSEEEMAEYLEVISPKLRMAA
jgi:hypothetical protein